MLDEDDRAASFENLKGVIKKDVSIPYWIIDSVSSEVGKEVYAFDDSLLWILVLTHENEAYFYRA
ncbi:MAG: hypothetical protein LUD27_05535 [Clostridia bacterium]|nr:hypothetical protein [Clostridia bacterium]